MCIYFCYFIIPYLSVFLYVSVLTSWIIVTRYAINDISIVVEIISIVSIAGNIFNTKDIISEIPRSRWKLIEGKCYSIDWQTSNARNVKVESQVELVDLDLEFNYF